MTDSHQRTAQPASLLALLNPLALYGNLWRRRGLIRQLALRYFLMRNRGTYLGVVWALLLPLSLLAIYTFVFNTIFAVRWGASPDESRFEFALVMFCGMALFAIFSESAVRSATLVLDNPNYVKKVVFPVEILPVASLGASLLNGSLSLLLLLLGSTVILERPSRTLLLFPLVLLPLVALSLGVAWFFAALGVFVRDVGNLAAILIQQMLFFLTPIFYRLGNIPEPYRSIAALNPMTVVVENGRRTLMWGELPDWVSMAWCSVFSLVMMQLGYAWFMKSKRAFADVM